VHPKTITHTSTNRADVTSLVLENKAAIFKKAWSAGGFAAY